MLFLLGLDISEGLFFLFLHYFIIELLTFKSFSNEASIVNTVLTWIVKRFQDYIKSITKIKDMEFFREFSKLRKYFTKFIRGAILHPTLDRP